jgi:glutathione S-transferase
MKPKNTNNHKEWNKAMEAVDGFFPAVANYLKHTPDGDDEDAQLRSHLQAALQTLEEHFASSSSSSSSDTPPTTTTSTTNPLFLVSDHVTLLDCSLIPKLYHLQVGLQGLKQTDRGIQLEQDYPLLHAYMNRMMERKSFQDTMYPAETILWGWGNARSVSAST